MPFGGGGHRLGARVGAAHRHPEHPCGQRHQGLDGLVELAPEAAAARGRPDAHPFGFDAEHVRHLVAVHVGGLGAGRHLDAVVLDAPRVPRLRLDVGVLEEGGLELAARLDQCVAARRRYFPGMYAAAGEHVVRMRRLDGCGARRRRFARVAEHRQRLPLDGEPIVGEPVERGVVAHQRRHRLAAVARDAGGEHRLVLGVGIDAEAVDARDVGGGEDAGESGIALMELGAVADGEACVRVRRAYHPQPQ